jgi:hypothetical protein
VIAVVNGKRDTGKSCFHISGLHPFVRVLGVVVVTVHRQAVATNEVIAATIVVAVFRANIIPTDRRTKIRCIGYLCFMRIGAVAGITNEVRMIYGKHLEPPPNLL